jgi:hypothetical protein
MVAVFRLAGIAVTTQFPACELILSELTVLLFCQCGVVFQAILAGSRDVYQNR